MRIIQRVTFLVLTGILTPALLFAAVPMTLDECIQRGLEYNPEINAYELAGQEADRGVEEAWGAFLPTLSLNYSYNKLSNNASDESDSDYYDQNSDSFSTRLTQPLFTGFSGVAGLKRARANKQYREAELRYMKNRLIQEISRSYYSLLYARKRTQQWRESVSRLESQEQIAAAWVEQRLAPQLRLHEIAAELSNARHELTRAISDQAIARAQLREWLALAPGTEIDVKGSLEQRFANPCTNLDACIELALQQRPEIELSRLNIKMAEQDARAILARNLPRAELNAAWTDYQRDYDNYDTSDKRDYYSVTLNLSMTPFQGGRNISAWRKQRIAIDRYRQNLAKQSNTIVAEVNTSFEELNQGRARIQDAIKTIEEARAAYEVATKSVEMGMYSLDDLLEAELRLTRAELKLTDAQVATQQAGVRLKYSIGRLLD